MCQVCGWRFKGPTALEIHAMSKHRSQGATPGSSDTAASGVVKTLVFSEEYSKSRGQETSPVQQNKDTKSVVGRIAIMGEERPTISFVAMVTAALAELGGSATSQVRYILNDNIEQSHPNTRWGSISRTTFCSLQSRKFCSSNYQAGSGAVALCISPPAGITG